MNHQWKSKGAAPNIRFTMLLPRISALKSSGAFHLADCCKKNGDIQQAAATGHGGPVVHGGLPPHKIIKRKAVISNSTRMATAN